METDWSDKCITIAVSSSEEDNMMSVSFQSFAASTLKLSFKKQKLPTQTNVIRTEQD